MAAEKYNSNDVYFYAIAGFPNITEAIVCTRSQNHAFEWKLFTIYGDLWVVLYGNDCSHAQAELYRMSRIYQCHFRTATLMHM